MCTVNDSAALLTENNHFKLIHELTNAGRQQYSITVKIIFKIFSVEIFQYFEAISRNRRQLNKFQSQFFFQFSASSASDQTSISTLSLT